MRLRLQRMAHAGAFVDHLHAGFLEARQMRLRIVARRLDDFDAACDDRFAVFVVRNRIDRRQDGEVHAERLVGHLTAALHFLVERLRRPGGMRGDEAQRAGIGHRADQFGAAHASHAAAGDRRLHAEHLGEARLDHDRPVSNADASERVARRALAQAASYGRAGLTSVCEKSVPL